MPSAEQMPGIQSTNRMCTSEPFRAECEYVAASTKKNAPRANWTGTSVIVAEIAHEAGVSYEGSG